MPNEISGISSPAGPEIGSPAKLLMMRGIRKAFPGVQAISSASFELLRGEIHALVGENGAGKSTLIKILNGVYPADKGETILNGKAANFSSPIDALEAGIATIYQEFTLVPSLPVTANLFLGREHARRGIINRRLERETAFSLFKRLGVSIDPETVVSKLTVAQQQLVEIARALQANARILVMDEPTAALTPREVDRLFEILRELKGQGIGMIFVSHRLDEIFQISDRITVMRDGRTVITCKSSDLNKQKLIEQMVGRPLDKEFPKKRSVGNNVRFEVRNLRGGIVNDVSFAAKRGEILGITGLMGAGRTDMARLIFGADRRIGGKIILDGKQLDIHSPHDAIRSGICLLTEDRKAHGLVLIASAKDNFAISNLRRWSRLGIINRQKETGRFQERVKNLNIRLASPEQPARDLSGGNQQKLLVARWLESDSQVVIFDEPTRGIDVGAKYEMYLLINELAAMGKVVIFISSELPEIIGMCDRILVMKDGRIAGEIDDPSLATQETIMGMAI